mmetsp:Transcript_36476/g.77582  ORF Transcript_36476/g.77582 Transcript_36476/m.77582 type:complete len:110 (+) Transcript_36476:179-508(+)
MRNSSCGGDDGDGDGVTHKHSRCGGRGISGCGRKKSLLLASACRMQRHVGVAPIKSWCNSWSAMQDDRMWKPVCQARIFKATRPCYTVCQAAPSCCTCRQVAQMLPDRV